MNLPRKHEIKICLICAATLIILMVCYLCCTARAESPFIETEGLSINQFIDPTTENYLLLERQKLAHTMAECSRKLGYEEDNPVIEIAQAEWWACEAELQENIRESQYWMTKFEEYPYATYIWLFFTRQMGFSDEVVAGILGNIMIECGGGGTLNLQYWVYGSGGFYYGMCQWGNTWFPEVRGMDLIEQCDFLASNIETQINAFGKAYGKTNAFSEFLQLTSCRDAALMFAQMYEACAAQGYGVRQSCAEKAYEYFTTGLN